MSTLALRSTRVVTPEGVRPATLEVRDGTIVALHAHDAVPAGVPLHEAHDAVIMPGLVDTHVHVNEPGRTEWEGFATATRAAAAGGVTTLVDMPLNSVPATVNRAALAAKRAAAAGKCAVDMGFLGGVVGAGSGGRSGTGSGGHIGTGSGGHIGTGSGGHIGTGSGGLAADNADNLDELAGLHEAGVLGFKCFLVPSGVDEFPPVGEAELARALARLAPLNTVLMAHCELPGPLAAAPAPPASRHYAAYLASRPAEAETAAVAMLLRLAEQHHARVHVVHVSSAASLPLIAEARARGVAVTAETCPHYLHFTSADVPDGATEYKCAPPIRGLGDRDALWRGLADGTLDQVVSDHSPCPPELKRREQGDLMAAWGGIASLQLGLPVVWTGMRARGLPLERLAHWMCAAPARLVGLGQRKGVIAPGRDADLVVWSPEREFIVRAEDLLQRHPLTPYLGRTLAGVVLSTWLKGERVFAQGTGVAGANGQMLHRETIDA